MEPGFRFRAAEPADYDRIVAVMDDWWGRVVHTGLPRLFLNHFHRTSIIAERDGDLAGFLVGFLLPAMGFTVTEPVPDYDGPSTDRVLFERHLST
jgi:hypothetical protein